MKDMIQNIYKTRSVVGRSGEVHKLHSAIDPEEGEFLFSIIDNDATIRKTLEVGCAYGLSSLNICAALQDRAGASHTIIDPSQNSVWDGVGIRNLETAQINFFSLVETGSEFALPRLLETNEHEFDLIFIDGWHTFDHTLVDCFYATRLLRVGGVLAIDDVYFASVSAVVDFLRNYPCYEEYGSVRTGGSRSWKKVVARSLLSPIGRKSWRKVLSRSLYRRIFEDRTTSMIALRKVKEDHRNWDWHNDAF
jgi:predicted O-methyltransferase YrrM